MQWNTEQIARSANTFKLGEDISVQDWGTIGCETNASMKWIMLEIK